MTLFRTLFPENYRSFPGKRWTSIALRTGHLVGVTGLGGAWIVGADPGAWHPYVLLTVVTGSLMLAIEIGSNGVYLVQLRGLAMLVKIALLSVLWLVPAAGGPLILVAVIISGIFAHAPARVRYYSPFHGRMIDSL